jgi:hypothetical protein
MKEGSNEGLARIFDCSEMQLPRGGGIGYGVGKNVVGDTR